MRDYLEGYHFTVLTDHLSLDTNLQNFEPERLVPPNGDVSLEGVPRTDPYLNHIQTYQSV